MRLAVQKVLTSAEFFHPVSTKIDINFADHVARYMMNVLYEVFRAQSLIYSDRMFIAPREEFRVEGLFRDGDGEEFGNRYVAGRRYIRAACLDLGFDLQDAHYEDRGEL